jgi:hypothetical protein
VNSVEDQIRAATRAEAETLREVRPLRLPPAPGALPGPGFSAPARRARRFRPWIAPVTAAAAVIALAISLVLVRDIPNGPAVPAAPPASSNPVPARYVVIAAPRPGAAPTRAVVRDTFTGAIVASVSAPAGEDWLGVTAAADDRTFVLSAARVAAAPYPPESNPPAAWYELRLPVSGAAVLRKLAIPATPGTGYLEGLALSPDGTKLAALVYQLSGQSESAVLRAYSVATGAVLHTWSTTMMFTWFQETSLSWMADGNQLAFSYQWQNGGARDAVVRMVQVTGSGHDLIADSRLVWSAQAPGPGKTYPLSCSVDGLLPTLAENGKAVVCAATGVPGNPALPKGELCPALPPWNELGFLQYPTAAGQPARTLYSAGSNCVPNYDLPVETLWTSTSGDTVIGYLAYGEPPATRGSVIRFGVFGHGTFRPLPVPPDLQATVTDTPYTIAW